VETQSSQKRSQRNSTRSDKSLRGSGPEPTGQPEPGFDADDYMDRSIDHVARVSAARNAAQWEVESFGDLSEYDITTIQGRLKETNRAGIQPLLDFPKAGLGESREER
jgi:hypothetical protein